ncbi:SCO family protein [candidate division KSB1 bacterium]|nr:SCO family protein [candidate division KSB1 bacterium]
MIASSGLAQNASTKIDVLDEIGIEQKLNEQIPLDLTFLDATGQRVQLRDYFGEKPVILSLVYYECPMLCSMILNGLLRSLNILSFDVGDEFNIVTVSFDPKETTKLAMGKKKSYLSKYGRLDAGKGWHFLTGDESSIQQLTEAVGFNYKYDPETNQFVHASGIMVLTPQGKLSRYFYGVEYSAKDLKFGLMEAANNKIGSVVDQLLLYCYHYDPVTGKYGMVIMNVIRISGTATVLVLAAFMVAMFRRDRKAKSEERKEEQMKSKRLAGNHFRPRWQRRPSRRLNGRPPS